MSYLNYSIGVPQFQTEVKFINPLTLQEIPMYNIAKELMKERHSDLEQEREVLAAKVNNLTSDVKVFELMTPQFITVEVALDVEEVTAKLKERVEVAKADYASKVKECDVARSAIIKELNQRIEDYKQERENMILEAKKAQLQRELDELEGIN